MTAFRTVTTFGSQELELLQRVEEMGKTKIGPRAATYDRDATNPRESWADLHEARLLGGLIPKADGGLGLDWPTHHAVLHTLAKHCAATAMTYNMHSISVRELVAFGTPEQKKHYYREILEHGKMFGHWGSEPGWSINRGLHGDVFLKRTAAGYEVSGLKYFCSLASGAAYGAISLILDGAKDVRSGFQIIIVPTDRKGMEFVGGWDPMGMRGTVSPALKMTQVQVHENELLGPPGAMLTPGFIDTFGLSHATVFYGIACGAFEFAAQYCAKKTFAPENMPLCHDPTLQRHFGEMWIQIETARVVLTDAIREAYTVPETGGLASSRAKFVATEVALYVTNRCLEVCGGQAALKTMPLERAYRDVRTSALMPPNKDGMLATAGKSVFGLNRQMYKY
jgi:alkylation response protein AidB-like acyl-CoA dehydrogenase